MYMCILLNKQIKQNKIKEYYITMNLLYLVLFIYIFVITFLIFKVPSEGHDYNV